MRLRKSSREWRCSNWQRISVQGLNSWSFASAGPRLGNAHPFLPSVVLVREPHWGRPSGEALQSAELVADKKTRADALNVTSRTLYNQRSRNPVTPRCRPISCSSRPPVARTHPDNLVMSACPRARKWPRCRRGQFLPDTQIYWSAEGAAFSFRYQDNSGLGESFRNCVRAEGLGGAWFWMR